MNDDLDRETFKEIVEEAKAEKLDPPFFIYCTIATYQGPSIEIIQVPRRS